MMFKQFDIDWDKVTIDETVVPKPSYVSVSQWFALWGKMDEEELAGKLANAFEKGYQTRSRENDQEVEEVKTICFNELKRLEKVVDEISKDHELYSYEKMEEIKKSITYTWNEIWQS